MSVRLARQLQTSVSTDRPLAALWPTNLARYTLPRDGTEASTSQLLLTTIEASALSQGAGRTNAGGRHRRAVKS